MTVLSSTSFQLTLPCPVNCISVKLFNLYEKKLYAKSTCAYNNYIPIYRDMLGLLISTNQNLIPPSTSREFS